MTLNPTGMAAHSNRPLDLTYHSRLRPLLITTEHANTTMLGRSKEGSKASSKNTHRAVGNSGSWFKVQGSVGCSVHSIVFINCSIRRDAVLLLNVEQNTSEPKMVQSVNPDKVPELSL
jgi:hypothetical protein